MTTDFGGLGAHAMQIHSGETEQASEGAENTSPLCQERDLPGISRDMEYRFREGEEGVLLKTQREKIPPFKVNYVHAIQKLRA